MARKPIQQMTLNKHKGIWDVMFSDGSKKEIPLNDLGGVVDPEDIAEAVAEYLEEHPIEPYDDTEVKEDIQELYSTKVGILESTNDTTDRTDDILDVINEFGFCMLGTGLFYTDGLTLPDGAILCGSGYTTRLVLDSSVSDGSVIILSNNNEVYNLSIIGSTTNITLPEEHGTRNGILSTKTGTATRKFNKIHDISIRSFSGFGFGAYGLGTDNFNGFFMDNIDISNCYAGIDMPYSAEYNKVTNVHITGCVIGCINNGGNNVFSNCHFVSNDKQLEMNCSSEIAVNNSHGSFSACSFNHSKNNLGIAIELNSITNGEMFIGCQIFYGKIKMTDCHGVRFVGCNLGSNTPIEAVTSKSIFFDNCLMVSESATAIINNGTDPMALNGCFLLTGEEYIYTTISKVNLMKTEGLVTQSQTTKAVSVVWNNTESSVILSGTSSEGWATANLFYKQNSILTPFETGKTYKFKVRKNTGNVTVQVYAKVSGGSLSKVLEFTESSGVWVEKEYTCVANTEEIMLRLYLGASGTVYNNTVYMECYEVTV